jgi:hypothetical protein
MNCTLFGKINNLPNEAEPLPAISEIEEETEYHKLGLSLQTIWT